MNYLEFSKTFFDKTCFSIHQVYSTYPGFNKNNIWRWINKGLLVKLRNGYYSFPEYLTQTGSAFYIANRIYRPSYISLHTALSFYGIIPEAVLQISSVTTLKTNCFENSFGVFSYKSIRSDLMFAYDQKPFINGMTLLLAQPEKAILDLLYLYPFYNTYEEMEALRFDQDIVKEIVNSGTLMTLSERFKSKTLNKRVKLLTKTFNL